MKTLLFAFFFISLTSLTFAQNEIAYLDARTENPHSLFALKNTSKSFILPKVNDLSKRIRKLQQLVSDYVLSEHKVYDPKDPSVYSVEFTEAQNKIIVKYNQDGKIIHCYEKYKNVRLPNSIILQISKSNPGWTFGDNIVTFKHSKDKIVSSEYKVTLEKNNKRKIVTIN